MTITESSSLEIEWEALERAAGVEKKDRGSIKK